MAILISLGVVGAVGIAGENPEEIHALIVTGIDYPGHRWWETTPVLQQELHKDSRIRFDVLKAAGRDPDGAKTSTKPQTSSGP